MKRSEMLEILEKTFFHYDNYTNIAQKALNAVEEAGMVPPERVRYTDLANGRTICAPECTWEPEDEQE